MWMSKALDSSECTKIHTGRPHNTKSEDWKSKLIENGQWFGEKVIEYGGKFVRRGSHTSIPDRPVNDGRANWMSDIRNSAHPNGNFDQTTTYSGYQNEFTAMTPTGRPATYSDTQSRGKATKKRSGRRVAQKNYDSESSESSSDSPVSRKARESFYSSSDSDDRQEHQSSKSKRRVKKSLKKSSKRTADKGRSKTVDDLVQLDDPVTDVALHSQPDDLIEQLTNIDFSNPARS